MKSRAGLALVFAFFASGAFFACGGNGDSEQVPDGRQTIAKNDKTEETPKSTLESDASSDPAPQGVTEDTVHFDTPPPPCPSDSLCDVGTCVRFATVEGWKDKAVCVTGFPCKHVTCGTGKACWVESPNVVCGDLSSPHTDGDAGSPKDGGS